MKNFRFFAAATALLHSFADCIEIEIERGRSTPNRLIRTLSSLRLSPWTKRFKKVEPCAEVPAQGQKEMPKAQEQKELPRQAYNGQEESPRAALIRRLRKEESDNVLHISRTRQEEERRPFEHYGDLSDFDERRDGHETYERDGIRAQRQRTDESELLSQDGLQSQSAVEWGVKDLLASHSQSRRKRSKSCNNLFDPNSIGSGRRDDAQRWHDRFVRRSDSLYDRHARRSDGSLDSIDEEFGAIRRKSRPPALQLDYNNFDPKPLRT